MRKVFLIAWLALCALKLALAARLPLFVDEAFYWQEGQRLAWAYSDLPGLSAWLARLGASFGESALALRLPFLAIGAALPWLVARMAAREFGERAGWQAGLLALLLPLSGTLGLLALPDVPLSFAAVLCLDAGLRLLRRVDALAAWELAFGLAIGGLSHYRFVAIVATGFLALLVLREGRRALGDMRVCCALAAGALAWLPLLLWNLHNADAGLRFQLVDRHPWNFSAADGLRLGGAQLLLATPVLLAAMAVAAWRALRDGAAAARFLACCGALPVLGFLALGFFADRERVSFHWPLQGWLAWLPLVPAVLARWSRPWRMAAWALAALGLAATLGYYAAIATPAWRAQQAAGRFHPDNFAGWDELEQAVREERARMPPGTRLLADNFKLGAELGFALGDAGIPVLAHPLNEKHGRAPQLALWGLLGDVRRDAPALLVASSTDVKLRELLAHYRALCEQVGPLPPPRVVNVDHGAQRFLLFRLPANRADGPCMAPALAYVDVPASSARVAGDFEVAGWAFKEGVGLRGVEILLDGRAVAQAEYGIDKPNVARFWGIGDARVGFRARVEGAAPGAHWLGLRLHGADGSVEDWSEQEIVVRQGSR